MDKKDKILILLAPVAVAVAGYVFFGGEIDAKNDNAPKAEDFTSINAPDADIKKTRTELYKDKYEAEHGEVYKRNIQSDESFFSDEVKVDTAGVEEELGAGKPGGREEELGAGKPGGQGEGEPGGRGPGGREQEQESRGPGSREKQSNTKRKLAKGSDDVGGIEQMHDVVSSDAPVVATRKRRSGFYGGGDSPAPKDESKLPSSESISIPCVVQEQVNAKQGSNISIRTTEDVTINNVRVPKNTLITGVVTLGTERLSIAVNNLKGETRNVSVKMKAYDLEGNEGLPVEGNVDKEIKKDVVAEAISESSTVVNVPIISKLSSKLGTKKVNDPTVPIPKGMKMVLKN